MSVGNNEHKKIDDVSTDLKSCGIQPLEALWCMNCTIGLDRLQNFVQSQLVMVIWYL